MKHKKLLIAVLAIVLLVGTTGAALLTYYGRVVTTATMGQSVLLDGKNWDDPVTHDISGYGGSSYCFQHTLENRGSEDVDIAFDTTFSPSGDGITVKLLKLLGYEFSGTSVGDYAVDITVVDGECEVTWTFDFPMDEDLGNGNMGYALVIALDGEGEGPAFQIHNNDGTDSNFAWGTHLVSPWGPTIDDGWFGWWSSSVNTLVGDLSWVECTGDRYHDTNADCIFTVTISKCMLGEDFHWAVWFGVGGFYDYSGYSAYPSVFSWDNPIVGSPTGNYESAELAEELTSPFTLLAAETLAFCICYEFDPLIAPGTYTIVTKFS